MNYDIDKYLQAVEKKKELEETLEMVNEFIKEQEDLMDATFNLETTDEEVIDLGGGQFRAKVIGNSIDTDGFILEVQTQLFDRFGSEGIEIYKEAEEAGLTIRRSYSRTKFLNGLKAVAKEKSLDLSGMIKAAEEENSQKTIKTKTIQGK